MKTKPKPVYPNPDDDPTVKDEPGEEIWDNVFLQQQFIQSHDSGVPSQDATMKDYNVND